MLDGFLICGDARGAEVPGVALLQLLDLLGDGDRLHDPKRLPEILGPVALAEAGHEAVEERPILSGDSKPMVVASMDQAYGCCAGWI